MKTLFAAFLAWFMVPLLLAAAPANDLCPGAVSLTAGVPYSMSTVDATSAGDPSIGCANSPGKGVWFLFAPSIDGAVTIRLCGSSFDTALAVFTGSCDLLTPLPNGCVDDSADCGLQSALTFAGNAGTSYRILVAGVSGTGGNLTIRADVAPVRIVGQPMGGTIQAGDTYTFSVQAVGNPAPTYQWRQNGSPIAGGTRSWLTRANASPSMQGNYTAVVTSGSMSETSSVATLTITPGLEAALDALGLSWSTGGGTEGWYRQTDFWHDGLDSARCSGSGGPTGAWMETVIPGAATLTFWWRFPCDSANTDYIRMSVNGQQRAQLTSPLDGWYQQTIYLGSGNQTCRWAYVEGAAPGGGPGYVDQVVLAYGGTAAQVMTSPLSQSVVAGTSVSFDVEALGTPPFAYQWFYKGQPISGATLRTFAISDVQPRDAGYYYATVQNAYGAPATSAPGLLEVTTLPLGSAVDYRGLPLSASSSAWFGQIGTTHDGVDAARSAEITHNQASTVEFEAEGPANISFWWKVSSETNYDALRFRMDSIMKTQIWGEVAWKSQSFPIPAGKHLVSWSYEKDLSLNRGQDAGWLDQVIYDGRPFLVSEPIGAGKVAVSWPGFLSGFVLQGSGTLNSGLWTNLTAPTLVGDEWVVTNQTSGLLKFYRLRK